MPLLNPPDVIPEAMRFLVRAILAVPGKQVERNELIAMVAPAGLVEAMKALGRDTEPDADEDDADPKKGGTLIAEKSLDALRMLGIVQSDARQVSLTAVRPSWTTPAHVDAVGFSDLLLDRVLALANPGGVPGDSQGSTDLMQSIVALHVAGDPLWPFTAFEPAKKPETRSFSTEMRKHFGDERRLWSTPNATQWLSLRRWAVYLGLARPVGVDGIIPDGSTALARRLRLPAGDYEVGEFITACAQALPLFDGGTLQFGHDSEGSGEHSVLSPGMSVSLLQLEADGLVAFSRLSDTGNKTIRTAPAGGADQLISGIKWAGVSPAGKVHP